MFFARNKIYFILLACVLGIACIVNARFVKPLAPLQTVHQKTLGQLEAYEEWISNEWTPLLQQKPSAAALQASFLKGRLLYKKTEWAVEYFFPSTAKNINGAPLPEIEPEEHIVVEPMGMQVIEEMIFPVYEKSNHELLLAESRKLKSVIGRLNQLWQQHSFRNDQVFDAMRQQLFRVITLGITGFDMPVALQGQTEITTVLQEIQATAGLYRTAALSPDFDSLSLVLDRGIALSNETSFNDFDRLAFITQSINPATARLLSISNSLQLTVMDGIHAIRPNARHLFDTNSFDVNYFIADGYAETSGLKVALGKKLFYDPVVSGLQGVSCASCHNPAKAFTDGLPLSKATAGNGFLKRNTPTLLNAGYQQAQFYDMRALSLEDQVRNVVENKEEFHASMEAAAKRLNGQQQWKSIFKETFDDSAAIKPIQIQNALASYVRSLSSFNSRFDQYMRGDKKSLSYNEQQGFNLFMGKAKCGTCHFMPLFNGTVPPTWQVSESEVIGVPAEKNGKTISTDKGRFSIHQIPEFEFAFKTPTLRNIAQTGPYMHNGVFTTLEEVLEFYNKGGGAGPGIQLPFQTLPADSLGLSKREISQIISFMHALTDTGTVRY